MAQFQKKPVVIEATQWFKNGDHPQDNCQPLIDWVTKEEFWSEGNVVRYYRHPEVPGDSPCISSMPCGFTMREHGWIDTPEGGHTVCPGDWIITGVLGERYPCKPSVFEASYRPVDKKASAS